MSASLVTNFISDVFFILFFFGCFNYYKLIWIYQAISARHVFALDFLFLFFKKTKKRYKIVYIITAFICIYFLLFLCDATPAWKIEQPYLKYMCLFFRASKAPGTIPEPENQVDLVSLSDNRGQPKEHKQNLAEDYPPANNKQVGQPLTANPVMQKEQIPFSSIKSQVVSTPSSVNSHSKSSNDLESKKTENLTAVSLDEWRDAKIKCMVGCATEILLNLDSM